MSSWAIDLGTTNTVVAHFDGGSDRPRILELPSICREAAGEDPLEAPRVVPSATLALAPRGFADRLGQWGPLCRNTFLGTVASIGRPALEAHSPGVTSAFCPSFKPYLGSSPLRTVAVLDGKPLSAREVARRFLRELFAAVHQATGERIRDLVFTAPVEAYEIYRAELTHIARALGVKRLRFLDEPVAAAIGYDAPTNQERLMLVVDFGGGTLDLALVKAGARDRMEGSCAVVAKEGRAIGGNLVDTWLLEWVCQQASIPLTDVAASSEGRSWIPLMRREVCRVKESLLQAESASFDLVVEDLRCFDARLAGDGSSVEVRREDLVELLRKRGLYQALEECLDGIQQQAAESGLSLDDADDVLMVGGSTLLPGVYGLMEARFSRDRVRAWQPFEAVGYGAAAFAAGRHVESDFIVHDYAFVTRDPKTNAAEYTVVVPRRTRFPTASEVWRRQLVPTCALGEPESFFKLTICELGQPGDGERRFAWDAQGGLHKVGGRDGAKRVVVPLNESNPTLGKLSPPHPPGDQRPRLDISFGVNAERWLVATVVDLWSGRKLMKQAPVVRLL